MRFFRFLVSAAIVLLSLPGCGTARAAETSDIYARENLMAWCIVPFDAAKRTPEERASMLEKLGLRRFAYDYRAEHIPQFDSEMEALQRHRIELTAWWFPGTLNEEARHILEVIKRHGVKPQLWVTGGGDGPVSAAAPGPYLNSEAIRLGPICEAAAALGLQVGLYNHGGWFGEPENQIAIIERLKQDGITNAGIVYNFHHGHSHLDRFTAMLERMKPYLIALNLNGMIRDGEAKGQKIVPLGQGEFDATLLKTLRASGWHGPVGILNHTDEDAETRLRDNLDGLDWLQKEIITPGSGGERPVPRSWKAPAQPSVPRQITGRDGRKRWRVPFGQGPEHGMTVEGHAYRELPVTVEIRARLMSKDRFNILAAADPKGSRAHWEIYSYAGSGNLCVYLPGYGGNFDSGISVTDAQWHDFGVVIESGRLRIYLDGELKKESALLLPRGGGAGGGLGIGRLAEGGIGCDGYIRQVRIRRGAHEPDPGLPWLESDPDTLGQWEFHVPPSAIAPRPAGFPYDAAPLEPDLWPHRDHPVNRERVYDFYAKQALHFRAQKPVPALLGEYPGLDGGTQGHWGNQTEDTWRDGRWNQMDCGPLMSGVFRTGGFSVGKGICVRLDEAHDWAACFDPLTAEFRALWRGGLVQFTDVRHGLMDGLRPAGEPVAMDAAFSSPSAPADIVWRGFYRHGTRTIFSYTLAGVDMLDGAWTENGRPRRLRAPAAEHPWREFTRGGPARWPRVLETRGVKGTPSSGWPYALDTLTLPFDNPWRSLFFIGGHDFFANGDLALCTMTGDVWTATGVNESLDKLRWRRIAAGLHQPLGLIIVDDKICVLGRDQITRLHDLNGDGEADFYECVSNRFTTPEGGHDYICGLERDAAGRFYTASGNEGILRITEGGPVEVLATGFRNPDGLGLAPDGTLTVPVSEGEWTPCSAIMQIQEGGFYGYPGSRPPPSVATLPSLVNLPRGIDNSAGAQTWVPDDRWGPLRGQMIHLSYGTGTHHLVLRENVGGHWQGAVVPLPGDFASGAHRGRFNPRDGHLYVSGMTGWGTYTPADGSLQRIRYTGGSAHLPVACEARDNGVLLTFSEPLDSSAAEAAAHFAQCWTYRYGSSYGSPEFSVRWPGVPGHDSLRITSAHLLEDRRRLFLEIPQLQPAPQVHLLVQPQPGIFRELFLTVHRLGPPYTEFPGYQLVAKAPPEDDDFGGEMLTVATARNPYAAGPPGRPLRIKASGGLRFATRELTARVGERLSLTLENPDVLPHNWVLLRPGSVERTGDLVNKLITDPDGFARHYVPDTSDVLAWTDMVNAGARFTIHFDAPSIPGNYPYICTFPGHWMLMKGILKVE